MELQIPINKINPTLEEIGHYYVQLLNNILDTHKYIIMWGQKGSNLSGLQIIQLTLKKDLLKPIYLDTPLSTEQYLAMGCDNYYKTVSEHKEIVRMFMSLQGAMYLTKPDVLALLEVTK